MLTRFSKTFRVTRFGFPIEDVALTETISTGISFGPTPGNIPLFYIMEACHAANYRYFHDWQELDTQQQNLIVAHYYAAKLIKAHQSDAEIRAVKRKQAKAKK